MRRVAVRILIALVSAVAACGGAYGQESPSGSDAGAEVEEKGDAAAAEGGADAATHDASAADACTPEPIACSDAGEVVCDPFDSEDSRQFATSSSEKGTWAIAGGEARMTVTGPGDRAEFIPSTQAPDDGFRLAMRIRRQPTASTVAIAMAEGAIGVVASLQVRNGVLLQCQGLDGCVDVGPWTDDVWHTVRWTLTDGDALVARLDCGPPVEMILTTGPNVDVNPSFGIGATDGPASVTIDIARVE